MKMVPDSNASRVLSVVQEGPATTAEVAAEVGMTSRLAGTYLAQLHRFRKVTRTPFKPECDSRGRLRAWLWHAA
jgi:hypothetical protein